MTEFTGFAASPIPAEPSQESVRLLRRLSGNRKMQERTRAGGISLWFMRQTMKAIAQALRPPSGGTARTVRYANGVRGRLVAGPDADPANGMLLWVRGGGFVSGVPRLEQGLAALYAEAAKIPAFLPRYRLAPEHPFPAAADDLIAAYHCVLDQGFPADRIRLGGTSAGGGLAVGLLGDLRGEGLPMPGAVILVSPVLELSAESALTSDAASPDPTSSPRFIERMNLAYAGDTPLSHPRLDYLASDMRGWPPILVQVGGAECIVAQAQLLGAAMRAAGSLCEVQVWPGQVHGFPGIGARRVPESDAALRYGAEFLRAVVAQSC